MTQCNFYNQYSEFSIESQVKDYVLSIIESGGCDVQHNQVTCICSPEEAIRFRDNRCSDIDIVVSNFPTGNRDFYEYQTVTIIIYKVYNG
jgi:hypothetical protein